MFSKDLLGAPAVTAHPVDVGQRTEAMVLAELVRRGYRVLVPFGVNQRYDLVIDAGAGRFVRAQCKTGRLRNGCVVFNAQSIRSSLTASERRSYKGEADVFIVYCPDTHSTYVVPVDEAPDTEGSLRIDAPANGQRVGIRWAADHALPE